MLPILSESVHIPTETKQWKESIQPILHCEAIEAFPTLPKHEDWGNRLFQILLSSNGTDSKALSLSDGPEQHAHW